MSVATELVPITYLPERPRRDGPCEATILALHQPAGRSIAPPLRLTRRGVGALAAGVALVAGAVVLLAWLSAPPTPPASAAMPATVTVHSGDTLWSIATRIAPDRDPGGEIASLERLNHLSGVSLAVGEVLRTR